jgi:PIN domain nuclease of toxin-antitoxin system
LETIKRADLVYVSAVSALEIGCKVALKKLALPMEPCLWYTKTLEIHDLLEIPVTGEIALRSSAYS